jgi:hypothetical protein
MDLMNREVKFSDLSDFLNKRGITTSSGKYTFILAIEDAMKLVKGHAYRSLDRARKHDLIINIGMRDYEKKNHYVRLSKSFTANDLGLKPVEGVVERFFELQPFMIPYSGDKGGSSPRKALELMRDSIEGKFKPRDLNRDILANNIEENLIRLSTKLSSETKKTALEYDLYKIPDHWEAVNGFK